MGSAEVNEGRRLVARLPRDEDLVGAILAVAREHRLELAQVWGDRSRPARAPRLLRSVRAQLP